jgi:mRNA interferase MazF
MDEVDPARGEVWWVDLDPTRGSETCKTRPAVVISTDAVSVLPVRLVVPLTEWKDKHADAIWRLPVAPSSKNGLTKKSAADALQVRCVSIDRFKQRTGRLEADTLAEISAAIALLVEFD